MISSARGLPAAFLLSLTLILACEPAAKRDTASELEAFAVRYAAAWSNQDPVAFAAFYAPDGVLRVNDGAPSAGRDAIAATAGSFMAAFPDMLVQLDELRHTEDGIEFHWHWTGTNTGPGGNGNAVDLRGHEVWTLNSDGLIQVSLGYYDEAEYERQMAADSSAAGPAE
mgnify:CR=1 FL=1